jgi:hypothetical protein
MFKFLKIISYPFIILFLLFSTYCLYNAISWAVMHSKIYLWFIIGFGTYIMLKGVLQKNLDFLETFTHELTHTIVGLVFFQKIHSFHATNGEGGAISHSGKMTDNPFILLAPYCLPVYTFALLILRLWITSKALWIIDLLIGLTFGFHAIAMKKQIGRFQPDIQYHGIFFSYLFIGAFILFHSALIIWSMRSGIDCALAHWLNCFVYVWKILIR